MRTVDLLSLVVFFVALFGSLAHMWRMLRPKCQRCGWRLTSAPRRPQVEGTVEHTVKHWLSMTFPFYTLIAHHLRCERCASRREVGLSSLLRD